MRKANVVALLVLWGCAQENPYDPKHEAAKKAASMPKQPPKVVGIDPDKFDCTKFVSLEEIAKIAGGGEIVVDATGIATKAGTPAPCTYIKPHKYTEAEIKQMEREEEARAKKAMSGRDTTIAEEVAAWGKNLDKVYGISFDCRNPAQQEHLSWMAQLKAKPESKARDVEVGKGGAIDHSGSHLIFLDDDTPCAVVVMGPDEPSRLALAQLVQGRLVLENAPMTPRAVQVE